VRVKHAALVEALTGRFDDHHVELARMLSDQINMLSAQIGRLTARIESLIAAIRAAQASRMTAPPVPQPAPATSQSCGPQSTRLDESIGIGRGQTQAIIAEIGLGLTKFPTADHLAFRAKLCWHTHRPRHV
jgi:transposase